MKTCAEGHGAIAHHDDDCPACEERQARAQNETRLFTMTEDVGSALVALLRAVGPEVADRAYREAFEG